MSTYIYEKDAYENFPDFHEFEDYETGSVVIWDGKLWKAITNYIAREPEDFSMAPGNSKDWYRVIGKFTELLDTPNIFEGNSNKVLRVDPNEEAISFGSDLGLIPEYKLIAPANSNIKKFDPVSMDVNGNLQKYPASGGETAENFSSKNIKLNHMVYLSAGKGIMLYTDEDPNSLYLRTGVAQTDGSIAWGAMATIATEGEVKEIRATNLDGITACITWIEEAPNNEDSLKAVNIQTDGFNITIGEKFRPNNSGSTAEVKTVDILFDKELNHIIWVYTENQKTYNSYNTFNGLTINPNNVQRVDMELTGDFVSIETTIEKSNIIIQTLDSDGKVLWREVKWKGEWWGSDNDRYKILSNIVEVIENNAISLGGLKSNNGIIFGQICISQNLWKTFYSSYISGANIQEPQSFGNTIEALEAQLVNTNSGSGYNIIIDPDRKKFKIYEGSSSNPSSGFGLVYTGISTLDTISPNSLYVTMFGTMFASIFLDHSTETPNNKIYFIDSNATRSDNYIGNAASDANIGEMLEIYIGLPMINHSMTYNRGDVFYLGPYKYQAISDHQVLMIVEETIFP